MVINNKKTDSIQYFIQVSRVLYSIIDSNTGKYLPFDSLVYTSPNSGNIATILIRNCWLASLDWTINYSSLYCYDKAGVE